MLSQENRQLCQLFADMLDYPGSGLRQAAKSCAIQLKNSSPGIAEPARSFADFVNSQSLESLEELYTQTFDITPATSLYLGYHLFGETPKRSEFLIKLTEAYQAHSFSSGIELADHLGIMLRFLSVAEDTEFSLPLLEECILPTLEKTEKELKKNNSEYALVIEPLRTFLRQVTNKLAKMGGAANA
ncbi:MAG: nitrate reductase molybdenum cofactor assembly chaperone [Chloroflexi bacterium]|nr:nitrate reductase molybdenum cofactor assembly chaperone [Chloroflexota bacterium]MBI2980554.1 nitrate reductase molybdenum cofactor assembly chaperone [Chloroflexota bacterium]